MDDDERACHWTKVQREERIIVWVAWASRCAPRGGITTGARCCVGKQPRFGSEEVMRRLSRSKRGRRTRSDWDSRRPSKCTSSNDQLYQPPRAARYPRDSIVRNEPPGPRLCPSLRTLPQRVRDKRGGSLGETLSLLSGWNSRSAGQRLGKSIRVKRSV